MAESGWDVYTFHFYVFTGLECIFGSVLQSNIED